MTTTALPCVTWLTGALVLLVRQGTAFGDAPMEQSSPPQLTDVTVAARDAVSAAADCVPAWVIDAAGIRRLPDRCPSAACPSAREAAPMASLDAAPSEWCEPPWFVDARGIQRVRQECVAAEPEPPVVASSVLSPNTPAARDGLNAPSDCDPMYWVDGRGIRRLRIECL